MEIVIQPDSQTASLLAARRIARLVREKPNAVLGLATGSTPLALYAELIRLHREEGLDFGKVVTFNLDEYIGLIPSHPSAYHRFMWDHLFQHINISPARVFVPSGMVAESKITEYCQLYEAEMAKVGGIDLQVLGIGGDGHIGFNEPGSSLASRTRIKTLTTRTRKDNEAFFDHPEAVPHHVITMGIGTIMESREIALLAFGAGKSDAVAAAAEGPITASCPASILQMHPVVRVFIDEGAASKLSRQEYYHWVYEQKPDWQQD